MTFVKVGERVLGVTCNHVIQHAESTECPALMLALAEHTPLRMSSLVARSDKRDPDYPFDIAVFEIDLALLQSAGKVPFSLDDVAPANLEAGEVALAVGFPGYARYVLDERQMVHSCCHVAATCHDASDRLIVLHNRFPDQPEGFSVGGLSGGPIFRLDSPDSYCLIGITSDGKGRVDATEVGGDVEELWLLGFPISESLMGKLLEDRHMAPAAAFASGRSPLPLARRSNVLGHEEIEAGRLAAAYFRLIDPRHPWFESRFLESMEKSDVDRLRQLERLADQFVWLDDVLSLPPPLLNVTWRTSPDDPSVAYFYFRHDDAEVTSFGINLEALSLLIRGRRATCLPLPQELLDARASLVAPEDEEDAFVYRLS